MRRLVALLTLAVTGLVVTAAPAGAHNPDTYAYWYCSLHRSAPEAAVIHSEAWALYPGRVLYSCVQDSNFFGAQHRFFVEVSPPFSGNSARVSGYQACWMTDCSGHS